MPPKIRITREMILDAAYAIARQEGIEAVNARTVAERLGCSTQPVLYQFAHVKDVRREVCRMADEYHTAYLMQLPADENPMIALGMNYIRFAREERQLFRLLFQSDSLSGRGMTAMMDDPGLAPMLEIFQQEAGLTLQQTKRVFMTLVLLVHGWASMLANNEMTYDEAEIASTLTMAFNGMIVALKMEEEQP